MSKLTFIGLLLTALALLQQVAPEDLDEAAALAAVQAAAEELKFSNCEIPESTREAMRTKAVDLVLSGAGESKIVKAKMDFLKACRDAAVDAAVSPVNEEYDAAKEAALAGTTEQKEALSGLEPEQISGIVQSEAEQSKFSNCEVPEEEKIELVGNIVDKFVKDKKEKVINKAKEALLKACRDAARQTATAAVDAEYTAAKDAVTAEVVAAVQAEAETLKFSNCEIPEATLQKQQRKIVNQIVKGKSEKKVKNAKLGFLDACKAAAQGVLDAEINAAQGVLDAEYNAAVDAVKNPSSTQEAEDQPSKRDYDY